MRITAFAMLAILSAAPAEAFDASKLPQICRDTIASMKADKPRFTQLNGVMAKSKKAADNASFCGAARDTLSLIIDQNKRLDQCIGEAANDHDAPKDAVDQLIQVKSYFRTMLEAAKKPDNDKFHCGLSSL